MDQDRKEELASLLNKYWERIEKQAEAIPDLGTRARFYETMVALLAKELDWWPGKGIRISQDLEDRAHELISQMSEAVKKHEPSKEESHFFFSQIHAWTSGIQVETRRSELMQVGQESPGSKQYS